MRLIDLFSRKELSIHYSMCFEALQRGFWIRENWENIHKSLDLALNRYYFYFKQKVNESVSECC